MRSEASIRRDICDLLSQFPHRCIFRINMERRKYNRSAYLPPGWPDISGSFDGTGLFIEVKRPGGRRSKEQIRFIERASAQGNIAFFADCIDDVIDHLFGKAIKVRVQ